MQKTARDKQTCSKSVSTKMAEAWRSQSQSLSNARQALTVIKPNHSPAQVYSLPVIATMAEMTDEQLKELVHALVLNVDLKTTGLNKFIKLLSKEVGYDLKAKKSYIKQALTDAINAMETEEESEESDSDVPVLKPKRKGGGGLSAKKEISDALANFLGKGKEMARTDIVKSLWEYIREHNLQNPENKKEIILDDAMRDVFGCDRFTMFTMNKYIGAHVSPFKAVDLNTNSTPSKPRKRKVSTKASGEKKKRQPGTQPPYRLSAELAEITGEAILPRPQVVSKIWEYIKANELQNPSDKREILCDEKLRAVMKKPKVTMFNMNKYISPHILERVERVVPNDVGVDSEASSDV
jgi:upstream activation factor subunit UAF30